MRAAKNESEKRSLGGMYDRQEKVLKRLETPERQAMGENVLRSAGILQFAAAVAGLVPLVYISTEADSYYIFFTIVVSNIVLILLCLVVMVLAALVIVRMSIGEAYAAGLLGFFIGGPLLSSTILALVSLVLVWYSQRV